MTTQSNDDLVTAQMPLVGHLVRELTARIPAHIACDDLRAAGMLALVQAARSFDPTLKVPFPRYASCRIRGALLDELRRIDWASRSVRRREREVELTRSQLKTTLQRTPRSDEVAAANGMTTVELREHDKDIARASVTSIDALCESDRWQTMGNTAIEPVHALLQRERLGYLCDAIGQLPPRLRIVVEGYFIQERPMADLAEELGVSDSRISQMRAEALALMRHALDTLLEPDMVPTAGEQTGARSRRRAAYVREVAAVRPGLARIKAARRTRCLPVLVGDARPQRAAS
jgi:RNA polymerase sigma factor for flagellar operon FliA